MDLYVKDYVMTLRTLQTARLLLRAPVQNDASVLAAALNNYEISKWLTVVPFPYSVADAEWFINENHEGRFHTRVIWSGDEFIGVMGIDGELGYWLAQGAWGQGYATEAGQSVVGDHFATRDDDCLKSSHFADNTASRRVLEKLGFVETVPHVHY